MNTQEQFESIYADYTQTPIEQIVAARLGEGSYSLPAISKAWVWYRFGVNASPIQPEIKDLQPAQSEKDWLLFGGSYNNQNIGE